MSHDNHANRLWMILKAGKQLDGKTNCREAWWKLLGDRGNRTLLMSRIGKLMELPAMIIDSLKDNYPNRGNTWTHWESHLDVAFASQNLNANWDTFIAHIEKVSGTISDTACPCCVTVCGLTGEVNGKACGKC